MRKSAAGFTIIEIVVTVVVIGILVGAAFFSYTQVQKDARNSQRSSKVNLLIEALEKYYAKNGEYPSCSALTQSASQVVTNVLPGLDPEALTTPSSPSGSNSITCTPLSAGSGPDAYAYIGDGSATCSSGNACLQYTLQYRNESTGAIVAVDGRHKTQIAATTGVTVTATTISDTQINLSWTASNNATSYQLQRADDANMTVNIVSSSPSVTTASATGLTPGKTYYFRVAPVGSTGQGTWSNTANATTTIAAPAATVVSSTPNGVNIDVTSSAATCGSGTAEYQLFFRNSATTTMPSFTILSDWSATLSAPVYTPIQGHKYEFQAKARCKGPNATSNEATSAIASRSINFTTPAAPTYLSPSSFDSPNHAFVNYQGYCPAGTTTINKTFRSRAWTGSNWGPNPWGFEDWWTNNTGSNKNVEYWGKYQCRSSHVADSPVSPESYNVIVVTP